MGNVSKSEAKGTLPEKSEDMIDGRTRQRKTIEINRRGVRAIVDGFLGNSYAPEGREKPDFTDDDDQAVLRMQGGEDINWVDLNKDGKTPNPRSIKNVVAFLEYYDIELWFDEFSLEAKVSGLHGHPNGVRIDDGVLTEMWGLMNEAGCKMALGTFGEFIHTLARRQKRHPVREYLDTQQGKWDRKKRIDTVFIDYLGVEDTPLHRAFGRKFMIAAVRRVREPGCDFAGVPILEGYTGGEGKSRFAKLLFHGRWFTDTLRFGDDSKTTIEQASGVWCAEVAELEGMTDKREFATIKAAISRTEDRARLAYGRTTTIVARQFVMIGTTNEPAYLKDRGGLRRFWPMRVDPGVLDKSERALLRNLDNLWAEAAVVEAAGEEHGLPRELWADATKAQSQRVVGDPDEEWLHEWLSTSPDGVLPNEVIEHACEGTSHDVGMIGRGGKMKRVAAKLGFVDGKRRLPETGKVVRVYTKGGNTARNVWLKFEHDKKDGGRVVIDHNRTRAASLDSNQQTIVVRSFDGKAKKKPSHRPTDVVNSDANVDNTRHEKPSKLH